MTKRHFEKLAAAIKAQRDALAYVADNGEVDLSFFPDGSAFDAVRATAASIADVCASENSRFDRARFLTACGF